VRYRALPLGLERVYVRRDLEAGRGSGLAGGALPAAPGPAPAPADSAGLRRFPVDARRGGPDNLDRPDLQVAGSKTIRFDLGNNRDLALHQTLDLRVEGTLSRDVRLRALLSDRNLPFQPEGNTAELEELDKVLIEVEGPKARVGLGDQDLAVDSGTLLRFSRRLQGLMAQAGTGANGATVTAAAQRGEFQTQEFLGTEGKQGPYALTDRLGGRGVVIVAGSERVWLDGVELKRGLDADYTIDYGRAELTFSPRHGITAHPGGRGLPVQRVRLPAQPLPRGGPRHARRRRASTGHEPGPRERRRRPPRVGHADGGREGATGGGGRQSRLHRQRHPAGGGGARSLPPGVRRLGLAHLLPFRRLRPGQLRDPFRAAGGAARRLRGFAGRGGRYGLRLPRRQRRSLGAGRRLDPAGGARRGLHGALGAGRGADRRGRLAVSRRLEHAFRA
jgi:hypothetical protein